MAWEIVIAILFAGASYVQAKKAQKKAKELTEGVEANIESNSKEIPVVYGKRRVGGVRVYIDTSRDKKHQYLYMVLAMAEGEVESITDIKIDDVSIEDDRFNYDGLLSERNLEFEVFLGSDGQEASTLIGNGVSYDYDRLGEIYNDPFADQHERDAADPNRVLPWSSKHKLSGIAYLALKFKWDEGAYTGIPDVTAVVKGRKVYDPRTSTTAWSDNPALCIRDYLTNERFGKGLPASAIDDVAFSQAANDLDSFIAYPYQDSPEYQYLFRMNHVVDTSKKIMENLNDMIIACRGFIPYSNGVYSLKIDQTSNSVLDIGPDQIISGIAVAGARKEDRFNQVKVNFFNASSNYKEDQAIYPEQNSTLYQQYLAEDEGEPLVDEIDLYSINNYYSAREMARLFLERSRQNMTIAFQGTSELINLEVGEVVSITHPTPAWTNKLFQVQEVALAFDGTVQITCIEYDAALYTYDTPEEEQPYVGTRLPDPNQVEAITNLTVSAGAYIENDGKTIGYLDIDWDTPDDALVDRYELEISYSSKSEIIEIASESYRFKPTQDGVSYTVSVRSVNGLGIRSNWVEATAISSSIDTTAPSDPSSISLTAGFKQIELSWVNPTDDDFDLIEIKSNTENNESTATVIASLRSDYYLHRLNANETRFYWLRALDRTGNASDWVYGGTGTTERLLANDFADGVIIPDYLDTSTQAILTSVENYDTDISNINTSITNLDTDIEAVELDLSTRALDSDLQNITQQLDDNLTTASERLLTMSLFASEQAGIMRDAGITVDPDNGSVSIQAVEQLRTDTDQQLTQVGLEIDAIDGQLGLYATRTFVENEIAEAQLDPTEFTAFTDLQARVNQAEIDIDANTASVTLKADQTELDSLDVRVSQAEIDIDGAEASIALKANQSDFTDLQTRITSAEIQLDAIDAPSITQTVVDVSNLTHRMADAEVQDLNQLLEIYDTRQTLQQDIAFARTQITADVTDIRESIATQRTELGALIDANSASLISEQTARANADSAITEDITQLRTDLTTAEGDITGNASAITSLDGRVTTAEGSITSQATDITSLQSSVTDLETDTTANATAISGLDTRVTSNETSITSQSTDITNLQTSLTTTQGDVTNNASAITTNATAITNLDTRVTTAEGTITSQSTDITNLQSSVTNLGTDTSNNATAINTLDTRVSQTETDISTQSTAITDLTTSVNEKIITFSQDDEPTENLTAGDLWLDTDDNNKLYRYSGTEWVEVSDNRIADTATALTQLTTTVTQNGTDITAISQDVTELRTDVNDNTSEIVSVAETASSETRASAKRLEQLVTGQAQTQLTEILNRESNQDFLSSEVAIVRSDFNAVTQANLESIAQTRTDLTALINGNSADITSEQLTRASADQALASDINSLRADLTTAEGNITGNADATTLLTARVDVTESDITSISADVTTLQSELDIAESSVSTNASAISALDTRVTSAEGGITSQATDITELETDLTNANTNITANSTAITNLDTRVTSAESTITSQSTSITSLSSSVGDLETAVGELETDTTANATAITGLSTTVTAQGTSISTNATAISDLSTTVGGNTTNISTLQTTTDGIKGQYSVTINNNGTVSGFGLVSDIIDGEPTSAFNVSADQFFLSSATLGELWDAEVRYYEGDTVQFEGRTYEANNETIGESPDTFTDDWTDITYIPFVVYTQDTTVSKGGENVIIPKGVYIKDGFIQNASITDANIQSLNADKITAGTISTSRLSIDGVTLDTDENGKLIIKENGVTSNEISDNAVSDSASAYTAGNQLLSTAYTTIQSASIGVDPVSRDLVTTSFRIASTSVSNVIFRIVKSYTFGSPPTPVENVIFESSSILASRGSNLYSYSIVDAQSGVSGSVVYKVEAKLSFAVTNPVNASDRSLTVTDLKR